MKDYEDEAFDDLERKQRDDLYYKMGWNSALEMAAARLQHELKAAFPADTLASFAVYLKELKK